MLRPSHFLPHHAVHCAVRLNVAACPALLTASSAHSSTLHALTHPPHQTICQFRHKCVSSCRFVWLSRYGDYTTNWTALDSIFGRGKIFLSYPKLPDRLWGPPNGYRGEGGGSVPQVKWPECEGSKLIPCNDEINP